MRPVRLNLAEAHHSDRKIIIPRVASLPRGAHNQGGGYTATARIFSTLRSNLHPINMHLPLGEQPLFLLHRGI
jgi:hypothetical protein